MHKINSLLIIATCLFSTTTFAGPSYPIQEYEILLLESLPEAMTLDMTLSDIEKTKESSRLGALKKRLNKTVFNKIAPLLASAELSQSFNLLQITKLLPLKDIVKEINLESQEGKGNPIPAEFIILISPKLPTEMSNTQNNPYAYLYPKNKASVANLLDIGSGSLISYEAKINKRMADGAEFLFQRQYANGKLDKGFFAGALIAVHAEGNKSWAKAKLAIGLPTEQSLPFEQENPQIKLKTLNFPRTPYNGYIYDMDNPIVMASFEHYASSENPALLRMNFGSLGPMVKRGWTVASAPSDSTVNRWFSWMNPYNVPHFRGEIRSVVGWQWVNSALGWGFEIQLNLHEVIVDLKKLEITDVGLTVDLPVKGASEILPTFRLDDPEKQFKDEGNKVLKEQKDKVQGLLDNGLLVLSDPEAQKLLFDTLNKLISKEGAKQ